MPRPRVLTEEQENELVILVTDFSPKPTLNQLSERFGISKSTVQRVIRRARAE